MNLGKALSYWTDDRVVELTRLHTAGHSCSYIAKIMGGGVTRNGIIGKVHRLGLERHTHRMAVKKVRPPPPPKPAPKAAVQTKSAPKSDPPREGMALIDLPRIACRWPVSDPPEPADMLFCARWIGDLYTCLTQSEIGVVFDCQ